MSPGFRRDAIPGATRLKKPMEPGILAGLLLQAGRAASCPAARDARCAGEEEAEAMMSTLRLVLLFVVSLALTGALMGCPGPNYAPYDNMNNNSPG